MKNMYEFETERLGFRKWKDEDKLVFAKLNANPDIMKYFPSILTKEQSDAFVDRIHAHFEKYGYGLWAVELKETRVFIGYIGLFNATFKSDFTPCVEIGWRLDDIYWNKGYATEGAKACLEYAFNRLGIDTIYSFTAKINTASIRVMEKIGLRKEREFIHPAVEEKSLLSLHVLYKIEKSANSIPTSSML